MSKLSDAPDSDVRAAKKELETRIQTVLVKLPKLVQHRLQSDSLWRITECMNVNENTYDFGRLPVYYKRPTAPKPKKYDCLRALATFVIVKWWDYVLEKTVTPYPITFLVQLENIAEKGLKAFALAGSFEKGFRMVVCKQCEDTGINQYKDSNGEVAKGSCSCPLGVARDEAIDEAIEPDIEPETETETGEGEE